MDSPDIRIVLVAPSHPGNIGAVARAMKNMALSQLLLVRPKEFPHPDATARATLPPGTQKADPFPTGSLPGIVGLKRVGAAK